MRPCRVTLQIDRFLETLRILPYESPALSARYVYNTCISEFYYTLFSHRISMNQLIVKREREIGNDLLKRPYQIIREAENYEGVDVKSFSGCVRPCRR